MKELLHYIIANILPKDTEVSINEERTTEGVILHLQVPEEHRGFIIGKGGNNIKAIRNVVSIIAKREGVHVNISIVD